MKYHMKKRFGMTRYFVGSHAIAKYKDLSKYTSFKVIAPYIYNAEEYTSQLMI